MKSDMSSKTDSITDILGEDLVFIEKQLSKDPTGFWGRTLIKTSVSFIEAELFSLKQSILGQCKKEGVSIAPEIEVYLNNKKYELASNGTLKEKLLQNRIKDDIKCIFSLFKDLRGFEQSVDYGHQGWSKLILTVDVRNRLTHPKNKSDLSVSEREIEDCISAFSWFIENVEEFSNQYAKELEEKIKDVTSSLNQET